MLAELSRLSVESSSPFFYHISYIYSGTREGRNAENGSFVEVIDA